MLFFTLNFLYCLSNMFYDFLETQINIKSRGRPTPEKINSIGELLQKGLGEGREVAILEEAMKRNTK